MLSRLGEAVKDAAETLRRAFRDPPSQPVGLVLAAQSRRPFDALVPAARPGLEPVAAAPGTQRLRPEPIPRAEALGLEARLQAEEGWTAWASGARVVPMEVFRAGGTRRLEVPALPRRARVLAPAAAAFAARGRGADLAPSRPRGRGLAVGLGTVASRRGLDLAFSLPMAIAGEDLRTAARPLQMRCSLQVVKATGENVRNLDLLGRYAIPDRGVQELRHDPASGRLLVRLGPEAAGAGRRLLLIARRKDDRSLVTCFPEDP